MALKALKVLWFFSLPACLAVFMYVYAAWPEKVIVNENLQGVTISKEALFYVMLAVIAVANAMVFAVNRIYGQKDEHFKAWFYGLIGCTNFFLVIGLSFISLYNSGEKYDFGRLGFIIYGGVTLVVMWAAAWPVYLVIQKFFGKQPV